MSMYTLKEEHQANRRFAYVLRLAQELHTEVPKELVLKGGTALVIGSRVPRYSQDLDYDSANMKAGAMKAILEKCVVKADLPLSTANAIEYRSERNKRNEMIGKYFIHCKGLPQGVFKVEIAHKGMVSEKKCEVKSGIKLYKESVLKDMKVNVMNVDNKNGRRTARDYFDVSYLLHTKAELFMEKDISILAKYNESKPKDFFVKMLVDDRLLNLTGAEAETIVIQFQNNVAKTLRHSMKRTKGKTR